MEEEYNEEIETYDETNESDKKYINILRSYPIDREVMMWVENKILNIERRIHKFSEHTLCAYIILGYRSLEKHITIEEVLEKTKTKSKKKKILDLISGDSTENTPIHELGIGMPIIICSPLIYISKIVKKFYVLKNLEMNDGMKELIKNIKKFAEIIFLSVNIISNFEPKSLACVFVYFFLSEIVNINKILKNKSLNVRKTHFKTLSLTEGKNSDINPKDFDSCLDIISNVFYNFVKNNKKSTIKKLITY